MTCGKLTAALRQELNRCGWDVNRRNLTHVAGFAQQDRFAASKIETTKAPQKAVARDNAREGVYRVGGGAKSQPLGTHEDGNDIPRPAAMQRRGQRAERGIDAAWPNNAAAPQIGVADEIGHRTVGGGRIDL